MANCKLIAVFFLLLSLTAGCVINKKNNAESNALPVSKVLYDTIAHLDSSLFEAFNRRDLAALKGFFSEELEFYHDLGGVTNYTQNLNAFGRTFLSERKLRRELVKSSL
ncbi:MAG TPA: nuclear transport factor 2 family protein, partial [Chitinophagaceae bacterium]|nr:nuclear transport factor 2 family protein [Chitinophagaceae bacterium]